MTDPVLITFVLAALAVAAAVVAVLLDAKRTDDEAEVERVVAGPRAIKAVHIAPSSLLTTIDVAELAGQLAEMAVAEAQTADGRPAKHRAMVPQDRERGMVALLTPTAEYDAEFVRMVSAEPLELPLEADIRVTRSEVGAEQLSLGGVR